MQRFSLADISPTPWANGKGETRVVAISPPNATFETFSWRASAASLSCDGPFSVLPGVDRSIALIRGSGVTLHGAAIRREDGSSTAWIQPLVTIATPIAFDGSDSVHAALVAPSDTTSVDFNFMSRPSRGVVHSQVRLDVNPSADDILIPLCTCSALVLLVVRGSVEVAVTSLSTPADVTEAHFGVIESFEGIVYDPAGHEEHAALKTDAVLRVAPATIRCNRAEGAVCLLTVVRCVDRPLDETFTV